MMWSKKRCCLVKPKNIYDDDDDKEVAGLRILTKISSSSSSYPYGVNSNVVIKPISLLSTTSTSTSNHDCYLKSCHLCHNPLPLDKEVYMYRGDLGFCSVECRDRQIYLDEIKEMEKILSSRRRSYHHHHHFRPTSKTKINTTATTRSVVFS